MTFFPPLSPSVWTSGDKNPDYVTNEHETKKKKRKIALANQLERKHDAHQTKNTYQIFINLHIIFIFVTDSARCAGSSNFMSLRLALHPQKN